MVSALWIQFCDIRLVFQIMALGSDEDYKFSCILAIDGFVIVVFVFVGFLISGFQLGILFLKSRHSFFFGLWSFGSQTYVLPFKIFFRVMISFSLVSTIRFLVSSLAGCRLCILVFWLLDYVSWFCDFWMLIIWSLTLLSVCLGFGFGFCDFGFCL